MDERKQQRSELFWLPPLHWRCEASSARGSEGNRPWPLLGIGCWRVCFISNNLWTNSGIRTIFSFSWSQSQSAGEEQTQAPGTCSKSGLGMEHPGHPPLLLVLLTPCPNTPSALYTDFWPWAAGQVLSLSPSNAITRCITAASAALGCFRGKGEGGQTREKKSRRQLWASPGHSQGPLGTMQPAEAMAGAPGAGHCRSISRSRAGPAGPGLSRGWQCHPPAAERHQGTEGRPAPENIRPSRRQDGKRGFSLPASRRGMEGTLPRVPLRASPGSLRQPGSSLLVILNKACGQTTGKLVGLRTRSSALKQ